MVYVIMSLDVLLFFIIFELPCFLEKDTGVGEKKYIFQVY